MGRGSWLLVSSLVATACGQARAPAEPAPADLKLDFGEVRVGGTFPRSILVHNPTQKDGILQVLDVKAPFTVLNRVVRIRANGYVTLHFEYAPPLLARDRLQARLLVPGAEMKLLLAGDAEPAPVTCSDQLDWWTDRTSTSSQGSRTVTTTGHYSGEYSCSNSSATDVTLSAEATESLGRFGVFEPEGGSITVPAHSFVRGTVFLNPHFEGDLSGTLTLNDDSGATPLRVLLSAHAVPTWLEITPYEGLGNPILLSFDTVPLGKSAKALVHVKNVSQTQTIPLNFGTDSQEGPIKPFTMSLPAPLGPGDSADITVTFAPLENGKREADFTLTTHDFGIDEIKIHARGFGGGPSLSCAPDPVDFGAWALGWDRPATVHCQSVGIDDPTTDLDDLRIGSIYTTGDFVTQGVTLPLTVPGGRSFDVPVLFRPSLAGLRTGQLHVVSSAGEVDVDLTGQAMDTSGCEPVLEPAVGVDFRRVQPGTRATLDALVENHGTGPCLVRDAALASGSHPAFSVFAPASAVVAPGDALRLPVTVDPGASTGRLTGQLTLWVEGSRALTLTAMVEGGCLSVGPSPLDLGRAPVGCSSLPMTLTLQNNCSAEEATVGSIDLAGGSAPSFVLLSEPTLPLTLQPGGSAAVTVAFLALQPGPEAGGVVFTTTSDTAKDSLLAPLQAQGLPGGSPVDRFDTAAAADVLVVVDDNPSSPVSVGLPDFAAALVSELGQRRIDYHLGVTGTSIAACDNLNDLTPDGRLLPIGGKNKVVSPTTPLPADVFAANLGAASCSAVDNGLEASYRALHLPLTSSLDDPRHPELNDGSLGFLRDSAELALVYLVASDDNSSHQPDYYAAHVIDVASVRHMTLVGGPDGGCKNVDAASRYRSFVDLGGGTFTSVCDVGWSKTAAHSVAMSIGKERSIFPLSRTPPDATGDGIVDEKDMSVALDGATVPSADASGTIWSYVPDLSGGGSVVFAPGRAPPLGTVVGINYGVLCQ